MQGRYENSIFFIDVDKIEPNPYQPRRDFEEGPLQDLASSIRQYGVLQPLVVSRVEDITDDGGMVTRYELIAGERRLRASKIAGLIQVPAIIRVGDDSMAKLELAIIENLQREDLNAVDRARAFLKLQDEFKFTHAQIGAKMGKSREYVSNTMRLLALPQEILDALSGGKITEGHTRALLMLSDRAEEQAVLFKEIIYKKINVRDAEKYARKIAVERIRNKEYIPDPEIVEMESKLQEALGTRVHIEKKENGGSITIDFFTNDDLQSILAMIKETENRPTLSMLDNFIAKTDSTIDENLNNGVELSPVMVEKIDSIPDDLPVEEIVLEEKVEEVSEDDSDLYNIKSFSI
ncbi:ParB/RepB/Spo0J family partition protein [Candidatus Nomurabacteria bacterium]|nr:MAG: ParB/RepB/Spo0J family partition protein [Candidatus Nomurabacteria bacterium]